MKFVIIAVVVLATLGVVSTAGVWLAKGALGKGGGGGTSVRVEKVTRGDLVEFVSASGEVEPKTKVSISARVAARIAELPFDEGDVVKKGDILVKFDDKDLRAALDSVKARYAAEEAQIGVSEQRIKSQESQLTSQRIQVADAERDLRRQTQLLQTRDVSQSVVDTAQARVDNLKAQIMACLLYTSPSPRDS